MRITADLVDVSDESRLWSETYDRTMTDIFEIQDEVAAAIIDALQIHVGAAPSRGQPTGNTEAYALFLRAKVAVNNFEPGVAENLLKEAVRLDPNFAEAWEMLASVYWLAPEGITVVEAQRLMGDSAARAIAIDPGLQLAQTYYTVATPGPYIRWRTLEAYERAAQERPDDLFIMEGLIFLLTEFGYLRDALELSRRYVELDPLSAVAHMHLPITLHAAGRKEEAVAALEFENQSDWDPQMYRWTILGLNLLSDQETAIARVEAYLQRQGHPNPGRFRELVINGQDPATGQAYLDRHIAEFVDAMTEVDGFAWQRGLSSLYLYFGHIDRYFELGLATNISATNWDDAGAHLWRAAVFHALGTTAHPDYLELAEETGVFELWDRRGPPDFCEKVDQQWVCE
ncbi:MAG: hypothetical protein GTN98_01470 [Woeseiaceae bacterium]|nr:hypothetical protein [Woeseiaceae bacterium]